MPDPTIQGFKLTTVDEEFELPDPPEFYTTTGGEVYTTEGGLDEYEVA